MSRRTINNWERRHDKKLGRTPIPQDFVDPECFQPVLAKSAFIVVELAPGGRLRFGLQADKVQILEAIDRVVPERDLLDALEVVRVRFFAEKRVDDLQSPLREAGVIDCYLAALHLGQTMLVLRRPAIICEAKPDSTLNLTTGRSIHCECDDEAMLRQVNRAVVNGMQ